MSVTDASVWISYFLADDAKHVESEEWFECVASARENMLSPRFLLAEVAAAIARRSGDPGSGLRFAERLRDHPQLALVLMADDLVDEATRLGAQLRLRGADATYIATAAALGTRLVTWDREQLAGGAALVSTATPADDLRDESTDS